MRLGTVENSEQIYHFVAFFEHSLRSLNNLEYYWFPNDK